MMDFIARLFGGGGDKEPLSRVSDHFKQLDTHQAGLSRSVALYVVRNESGSVLSTLSMAAVQTHWRSNGQVWPISRAFKNLFASGVTWTDEQKMRLGDTLAALHPLAANSWGQFGTAKSPDWLRHILSAMVKDDRVICDMTALGRLVAARNLGFDVMLDIVFGRHPTRYNVEHSVDLFDGVQDWLGRYPLEITAAAGHMAAGPRAQLVQIIGRFKQTDTYLDLLVDSATASAKTVRDAGLKTLTGADPQALTRIVDSRFPSAATGLRTDLVSVAARGLGANAGPLLEAWLALDPAPKVRLAIEMALSNLALSRSDKTQTSGEDAADGGDSASGYTALDGTTVHIPPLPLDPETSPLSDKTLRLLAPSIASFNLLLEKGRKEAQKERWHWSKNYKTLGDDAYQIMKAVAESGQRDRHAKNPFHWMQAHPSIDKSGIDAFFASPELSLRHLTAVAHSNWWGDLLGLFGPYATSPAIEALRRRVQGGVDLRTLNTIWMEIGGDNTVLSFLTSRWGSGIDNVEPERLWPLVTQDFVLIEEALGFRPQSGATPLSLTAALDLLGTLPKVPQRLLMPLMSVATCTRKGPRSDARQLLAGAPDIDIAIVQLLSDGRQEVRAGAAEWLAQRGDKTQVKAIRQALKSEKSDVARAALISALERLGDDVSDVFDRKRMKTEAETGLAKTKGIDWFPMDNLPALKWQDGEAVDPVLPRWWIVLANKLKQPAGNALIDLWLDRLAPGDAHRLGRYVLTTWIEQDTRTASQEEANAHALAEVDGVLQRNLAAAKRWPQSADYYITDRDKLFAQIRNEKLNTYLGSAADNKGILALATRVDGADAAKAGRAYLKNHGSRVSQCKAVLDILASNPSGAAIQVVLATANRFKARTVQAHAAALIDDIASRRGWTTDELADRTIPTAGLDEAGNLELDCGRDRTFRLVLDAADNLILLNASGNEVKALPAPRIDEEKPLIDEAKKLLATARKEIKQVMPDQAARLREAMCLERRWPADDWQLYLLNHPLVSRLARRLVWMGLDAEGRCLATFRPLDDNSLTDTDDNTVDLSAFVFVQPAHSRLVDKAAVEAWRAHLADYEIAPPFDQFGRDLPVFDKAHADDKEINDRRGWMIETFKLRGAAIKLDYMRGAAEDGGVFMTYERRYNSAGLVALIHFSGSPLPEENMPAALFELTFARIRRNSNWHGATVTLGEVPPVLLAETWQDLHDIAAKGTGFDPDWKKKTPW